MTSFEHQKNSVPHHLLEALTPVRYTYGFIDFCWIKSINTFNIQNINQHVSLNNNPLQILQWDISQHLRTLQASNVFFHPRKKLKLSKIMKRKIFFWIFSAVFFLSVLNKVLRIPKTPGCPSLTSRFFIFLIHCFLITCRFSFYH